MCVNVCFLFFFQVRFFFDISLSLFFFVYFLHGKLQHKWTFCLHFFYLFSIGMMMPFRGLFCNIQKTHSDLDLAYFFCFRFSGLSPRALSRGRDVDVVATYTHNCRPEAVSLVLFYVFFVFLSLKLGSLRLKWTISFFLVFGYWLWWNEKLVIFFSDLFLRIKFKGSF